MKFSLEKKIERWLTSGKHLFSTVIIHWGAQVHVNDLKLLLYQLLWDVHIEASQDDLTQTRHNMQCSCGLGKVNKPKQAWIGSLLHIISWEPLKVVKHMDLHSLTPGSCPSAYFSVDAWG